MSVSHRVQGMAATPTPTPTARSNTLRRSRGQSVGTGVCGARQSPGWGVVLGAPAQPLLPHCDAVGEWGWGWPFLRWEPLGSSSSVHRAV